MDAATNAVSPTRIAVGNDPLGLAITPDGRTAYVVNGGSNDVSVIDTATNTAARPPIPVGLGPVAIAITPDGRTAYVISSQSGSVTPIDVATNKARRPIRVGGYPDAIAIVATHK